MNVGAGVDRRGLAATLAIASIAIGLGLLAVNIAFGAMFVLAGAALLVMVDRRMLVIVLAGTLPLTTIGWPAQLALIDGRVLDARLVLTFGVAALGIAAVVLDRRRPTAVEMLLAGFIVYAAIIGIAQSDSYLTWVPYVARLTTSFAALSLAVTHLNSLLSHRALQAAIVLGFGIPSAVGVVQILLGLGALSNDTVRATGFDRASPVVLALTAQMALFTAYAALTGLPLSRNARIAAAAAALVGGGAIIASATRLVLATAWAGLSTFESWRRRWPVVAAITVILVLALVVRPDFTRRFSDVVILPGGGESPITGGGTNGGQQVTIGDPSLRFRLVIWNLILTEWTSSPIIGIGPGMTAPVVAAATPVQRVAPHNDYVGVLAETGIAGLAVFLGVQLAVLIALTRRARTAAGPYERRLRVMAAVTFVAFNVLGVLNNPMYSFDIQFAVWALVGSAMVSWPTDLGTASQRSSDSISAANRATDADGSNFDAGGNPATSES